MINAWNNFKGGNWESEINVEDFIQRNYKPYEGDESFLSGPTERTKKVVEKVNELLKKEIENNGVLKIDASHVMAIDAFGPGYIDKESDLIVGLQTDEPLKRGICPFGGIRMVRQSCNAHNVKVDKKIEEIFKYVPTHNDGVFNVYSDEMHLVRKAGLITGLPDSYGRGRIIGDYRRVPLYGLARLIEEKQNDYNYYRKKSMTEDNIRICEEISKQLSSMERLKDMASSYGYDISSPAKNVKEAIQWLYFAYLGAIKEANGAAMSLGRTSTFIDIYAERDLANKAITEEEIQEYMDDFVLKLRVARHLRTPEYDELFAGDPMWITEGIGGMGSDGRTLVTKNSYRMLNTLYNLGPSPEPNLTVLWSSNMPSHFKRYCAQVSIDTDSIQYENDDIIRPGYGEDYSIACCVSAIQMGKQMQFFGARCNLAKILLLAINGGRDEISGIQVGPEMPPLSDEILDYNEVMARFNYYRDWLCELYVNITNIIHYMHDKYDYEKIQMALLDTELERLMAFGVAGLSVVTDSLSAIKYAKVKPIKDSNGLVIDYKIAGDFPKYGNDDDRVDSIAADLAKGVAESLKLHPTYRNSRHTLSVLTITSNVVYGKKTGNTPDGRKSGEPFAPGANPMCNRDETGALASLNSVAKLRFDDCQDGVSCTFTITPEILGKNKESQKDTLVHIMGGYFIQKAHHLNINILSKTTLTDAMSNPEKYPNLTIRVSGYPVKFHSLTHAQQLEVINGAIHEAI